MKQRILVLGAGGFIGRRVVKALSESPWAIPVAAYHRLPTRALTAEQRVIDATDASQVGQALHSVDGAVNCVAGNADVLQAAARVLFRASQDMATPPRIVHLSSMAVYGSATGVVEEDAALKGDLGPYSLAKIQAEREAGQCVSVVTLRPGCVYGPESSQWSGRIARWLVAHRIGDLGAAGDGFANLLYIDDLVAAILIALRTRGIDGQAFNLSMPSPPTWNEYFLRYARALDAVPVSRISRRRLKLESRVLAPPLKVAEILLHNAGLGHVRLPAPMPPSLLRLWQQEIVLDGSKTQNLLRLYMTPLDQGLRATANWFLGPDRISLNLVRH
jgi:nucleoside-diphosphate-sugar epimerase